MLALWKKTLFACKSRWIDLKIHFSNIALSAWQWVFWTRELLIISDQISTLTWCLTLINLKIFVGFIWNFNWKCSFFISQRNYKIVKLETSFLKIYKTLQVGKLLEYRCIGKSPELSIFLVGKFIWKSIWEISLSARYLICQIDRLLLIEGTFKISLMTPN